MCAIFAERKSSVLLEPFEFIVEFVKQFLRAEQRSEGWEILMGNEVLGIAGFTFLWPLALITLAASIACGAYTEAEHEEGVLTFGGRRMIRSRIALGVSCGIYCLCLLLDFAFTGEKYSVFAFWGMHWQVLLIAMAGANVSSLFASVYGFQARGRGRWIIRTATSFVAIASTTLTLLLISNIGPG